MAVDGIYTKFQLRLLSTRLTPILRWCNTPLGKDTLEPVPRGLLLLRAFLARPKALGDENSIRQTDYHDKLNKRRHQQAHLWARWRIAKVSRHGK